MTTFWLRCKMIPSMRAVMYNERTELIGWVRDRLHHRSLSWSWVHQRSPVQTCIDVTDSMNVVFRRKQYTVNTVTTWQPSLKRHMVQSPLQILTLNSRLSSVAATYAMLLSDTELQSNMVGQVRTGLGKCECGVCWQSMEWTKVCLRSEQFKLVCDQSR